MYQKFNAFSSFQERGIGAQGKVFDLNLATCNFLHRWITIHSQWPKPRYPLHCACGSPECCWVQWLHRGELIHNWQDPCRPCHWFY